MFHFFSDLMFEISILTQIRVNKFIWNPQKKFARWKLDRKCLERQAIIFFLIKHSDYIIILILKIGFYLRSIYLSCYFCLVTSEHALKFDFTFVAQQLSRREMENARPRLLEPSAAIIGSKKSPGRYRKSLCSLASILHATRMRLAIRALGEVQLSSGEQCHFLVPGIYTAHFLLVDNAR